MQRPYVWCGWSLPSPRPRGAYLVDAALEIHGAAQRKTHPMSDAAIPRRQANDVVSKGSVLQQRGSAEHRRRRVPKTPGTLFSP